MKALVTGAAGFVGSRVVDLLLGRGDTVIAFDLEQAIRRARLALGTTTVAASLDDVDAIAHAARGVDVVYHLAGVLPGNDPRVIARVNVDGTRNVAAAAAAGGVARFVFASSTSVYAPVPQALWPITESYSLVRSTTAARAYARSKIAAERLLGSLRGPGAPSVVVLRIAKVYGAESPFVTELVRALLADGVRAVPPTLRRHAMQWVHREDAARAVVVGGVGPASGVTCNIAGPEVFDARRMLAALAPAGPSAATTPPHQLRFDLSRARAVLGYQPRVTLEAALADLVDALPG
jgi:UDP-glucose 4-epimerase